MNRETESHGGGRKGETDEHLLTLAEAASFLRISRWTLYGWIGARYVPHFKLGSRVLFRRSELLRWLEARRVPPGGRARSSKR